MKPCCRQKNHKKNQENDIATMKPSMLIEGYAGNGAHQKDAESPSTEALTGGIPLRCEPIPSTKKTSQGVLSLIGTRKFHTV